MAVALLTLLVGAAAVWFSAAPPPDPAHSPSGLLRSGAAPAALGRAGTTRPDADGERAAGPAAPAREDERRPAEVSGPGGAPDAFPLTGRVVDGSGAPVSAFQIQVIDLPAKVVAEGRFRDPQGRFELPRVPAGSWEVIARAHGYPYATKGRAEVPQGRELVLVLRAPGSVRGLVRDPFGLAVASARVRNRDQETRTESDGSFALTLDRGTQASVYAAAEGYGPSEVHELTVPPETQVEIELTLAVEAVVRGVVLDEGGRPEPGAEVHLAEFRADPRARGLEQAADEEGRFEFRGLSAGSYLALVDEGGAPTEGARGLRAEQVQVAAGETVEVVLGGARTEALQLVVRATLAGLPCTRGKVFVFPEGPGFLASTREAPLDDRGRAAIGLPGPGRYVLRVERTDVREVHTTRAVDVPDVTVFEVELALPAGALGGRVLAADGPRPGQRVVLVRERSWDPTSDGDRSVQTDQAGAFAFEGLAPGSYSLTAPGVRPLRDLELGPGERLDGLELAFEPGGAVAGQVLDPAGQPASDAAIYARGADGSWLAHGPGATSRRGDGSFDFRDLPAGEYTFCARRGELASQESEPVRVAAGASTEVELRLAPGAMVVLALVDADGAPAQAGAFRALDAAGRGYDELRSPHDLELFLRDGFQLGSRVVGPLPPGNWRVEARAADGRRVAREVVLAAGWSTLELRLE